MHEIGDGYNADDDDDDVEDIFCKRVVISLNVVVVVVPIVIELWLLVWMLDEVRLVDDIVVDELADANG